MIKWSDCIKIPCRFVLVFSVWSKKTWWASRMTMKNDRVSRAILYVDCHDVFFWNFTLWSLNWCVERWIPFPWHASRDAAQGKGEFNIQSGISRDFGFGNGNRKISPGNRILQSLTSLCLCMPACLSALGNFRTQDRETWKVFTAPVVAPQLPRGGTVRRCNLEVNWWYMYCT